MIGIDLMVARIGAAPAPAPAAPPANLIDSSQNIYKSNPLFFDPNAPAPTSATSYYPENPGFVEDPRSLDVNRDFGMTKYAPQWDTPEQAALTGIDAMVGAWRLDTPVNEPIASCPICAGRIVERCRCALADGKCENGHEWHRCLVHQRTLQGPSDHALGPERCQCHRSLTIGTDHARRADCPPLTHCTDIGAHPDRPNWHTGGPEPCVGAFDLGALTRDMAGIKPVTTTVAAAIYRGGANAIEQAKIKAVALGLPGGGKRDECFFKLQWHRDAILRQPGPNALYGAADDLKKWALQAFIEWNAVDAGAAQLDAIWAAMWGDVAAAIAALPKDVADAAGKGISALQWIAGSAAAIVLGVLGIMIWRGRR